MCGIIGKVGGVFNLNEFSRRQGILTHRGPDYQGVWSDPVSSVIVGHTRLSIIDTSSNSNQPFISEDGLVVVVFNGEIFNYRDIRDRLQTKGVQFKTTGDTEVLLQSYLVWGTDCLAQLNGMWSFAVVDRRGGVGKEKVFLSRDRAGEKPLYFSHSQGELCFASELKALSSGDIDPVGLNFYLSLGYVPHDNCLFSGVNKLPPAHCAVYSCDTGTLNVWRYWSLPENLSSSHSNVDELRERAESLILDSVSLRMEADVPVGVLLSGGLDSSLIAAASARVSSSNIQTFTISFPGSPLDEARHASKVASFLGTDHNVLELGNPSLDLLSGLSSFVDEPIADSSILPAWMVFGMAKQHVSVALGGDGGDELFGGYTDYTSSLIDQHRLKHIPRSLLGAVSQLASYLPAGIRGRNRVSSLREGALQQMIWGRPYFDERLRSRIFKHEVWNELESRQLEPECFLVSLFSSGTTDLDRMTRTHFGSILPDDFLVKVDRASMAHSLEVRAPMLDHRLIEFCFSQVPDTWKVKGTESRRLQRLIGKEWLPHDLDINRKQGFSIPINEWLRAEGEAKLLARMEALPDLINLDEVRSLVRGHLAGRANGGRLFALIMLDMAMRNKRA